MAISDPRDVPNLSVWYSAEAETGYTEGQEITQWTDLSGNGYHAIKNGSDWRPAWQATTGPTGGPSLWFNGGQSLALPSAVLSGATSGEIFVQFRPDNRGSNSHWAFGADTGADDENHFPYSGTVYEGFGRATAGRRSFSAAGLLATWFRYNVWAAPSDWAALANEVTKASTTLGNPVWTSSLRLGRGRKSSADSGYLYGNMSTVLVFRRKLTTAERADVVAWMQANPSGGVAGGAGPAVTGSLAGSLSALSGSLAAAVAGGASSGSVAATLPALAGGFAGQAATVTATADTYANDGYGYTGVGTVDYDPPIAPTPARVRRVKVQHIHQSLPAPTLVDGRPV